MQLLLIVCYSFLEVLKTRFPETTQCQKYSFQKALYRILLNRIDPAREIYLAVTNVLYDKIFSEPIGKAIISDLPLKLIVVNLETVEIQQWIPSQMIEKL